jgi:hypothetical protein
MLVTPDQEDPDLEGISRAALYYFSAEELA